MNAWLVASSQVMSLNLTAMTVTALMTPHPSNNTITRDGAGQRIRICSWSGTYCKLFLVRQFTAEFDRMLTKIWSKHNYLSKVNAKARFELSTLKTLFSQQKNICIFFDLETNQPVSKPYTCIPNQIHPSHSSNYHLDCQ